MIYLVVSSRVGFGDWDCLVIFVGGCCWCLLVMLFFIGFLIVWWIFILGKVC